MHMHDVEKAKFSLLRFSLHKILSC